MGEKEETKMDWLKDKWIEDGCQVSEPYDDAEYGEAIMNEEVYNDEG